MNDTPRVRPARARRKPDSTGLLAELPRPAGGFLRLSVEIVTGRRVVRLAHVTETGAAVHAFVIETSELPAVVAALTAAASQRSAA